MPGTNTKRFQMPANAFSYPHANVNTNRATSFRTASEISNARPYVSHHHNDNSHRNQYQTPKASSSSAPLVTTVITHTITEEEINDDGYHDDDAPWYQVMRKRRVESGPHHDIITDTIQKVSSSSPSLSTTPFPYRSPQSTSTSLVNKKQTLSKNFNSFVIDSSSDEGDNNDDSNSIYMID